MLKPPKISVLMPLYNAEKYLIESINSILDQSFRDFELIILDDASTDNSLNIARKLEKKDKRIKVFQNKTNKNIATSRNILLEKAQGEYIAWQDADDISSKKRLEWQVEFLDMYPQVGIVGGYLQFFDERVDQGIRRYDTDDKNLRKKIFRYSPVAQPTAMIRKEALIFAGKYGKDLSPAEDIDMSFRIGEKYQFANIPEVTLRYRNYDQSSTYQKLKKIETVTIRTRFKYWNHPNYSFSLFDLVYNGLQWLSIFLIPSKWKIQLFNLLRNS